MFMDDCAVKQFQDFIKRKLHENGWSQRRLAEKCGVSHSVISKALREDNPTRPDTATLAKIAEALSVDYLTLIAMTEPDISGIDIEARVMAQEFAKLTDAQKRTIRAMLTGFAFESGNDDT
jgi:transcriptional regulator with XRE-family HTH domain